MFRRTFRRIGIPFVAALTLTVALTTPAAAAVSQTPASWTPTLASTDSLVRQLTPCGSTMYAVGAFTKIAKGGTQFTRNNAFAFSATNGTLTSFDPNVNGVVNSIALDPTCTTAYLGGKFTSVGGSPATNIAAVNASTGALLATFGHNATAEVEALLFTRGRLLVGGFFTKINGTSRTYFASVDPITGHADTYVNLAISGNYPGDPNRSRIYNFQLSHGGDRLLATGDFTSVGGRPRQQVVMFDLGATSVTVDGWTSNDFTGHCLDSAPFYAQDAAWSADDSRVFVATTGGKIKNTKGPSGICDAALAYPSTPTSVTRQWRNYTGCDSLYTVVADANNVYVAGHERWADNTGCDVAGPTAKDRQGVGDIDPVSGLATSWNPTRSRGEGADDLVLTSAGLWIASDNKLGSTKCGGVFHPGICFFPN